MLNAGMKMTFNTGIVVTTALFLLATRRDSAGTFLSHADVKEGFRGGTTTGSLSLLD